MAAINFDYARKRLKGIGYIEIDPIYSKTTKSIYYQFINESKKAKQGYKLLKIRYSDHLNYNRKVTTKSGQINIVGATKKNIDDWIDWIIDNNAGKTKTYDEKVKDDFYNLINSNKKIFSLFNKKENEKMKSELLDYIYKNKKINLDFDGEFYNKFTNKINDTNIYSIISSYIQSKK
jgi:hypothetical protein